MIQRVSSASVHVGTEVVADIDRGLCVLVGVAHGDTAASADHMAERLWTLRIFEDDDGKMNRSASDLGLALLVVSQFTLCADTSRGRRPSFGGAAPPEEADAIIDRLVERGRALGARVATGRFGARMAVSLVNDGPATFVLET